ncbi:hypothetical protein SPB21_23220 [Leptothoe sp. ISB3NOV94-8A]|uniref:Uncharacterized protein n=1 Tax=Adonisia turfae CCMR0081 TaxID=2292702 RepID=A0A6M0RRQ8_9CYAN|nr:hypothetical protein [Adonisia turfae]MDV3352367.1 hypothetical protein [Leptothoe sp. LEGE 181152]NEZ58944.1 hypothetical protein [Adonisia turfae CCMR0081]
MVRTDIQNAQHVLYDFFLYSVQTEPVDVVLATFRRLFVDYTESSTESELPVALYSIVIANSEQQFLFTLKRVCYILINNWGIQRQPDAIRALIKMFDDQVLMRPGFSLILKRLRIWMRNFITSQDFHDLKLFAARYEQHEHWSNRYTSYLLAPQYLNLENPLEQREAARHLSSQLKSKFRFDLAMYTAKSQMESPPTTIDNPTVLGEAAINLIKMLLLQPGRFGYENLANLLRKQCQQLTYWEFKRALLHYLAYALPNTPITRALKDKLPDSVLTIYRHNNSELLTEALILRTCKRVIDILTCEDGVQPSKFFSMFLAQGNPLVLVILLLKIALFCPNVQSHLELRIASLIRYYETYSEEDCRWVINFFEVFRITFAVYASGTLYNLVQISTDDATVPPLSTYRIFSQLRDQHLNFNQVAAELEQRIMEDETLQQHLVAQTPLEIATMPPTMQDAIAS